MDWNDVRYFLAVHRAGTLAGAARALDVEHSTVSRRLGALERDLGAKLFVRTPDGFTLTAAGESVMPQAETMERAAEAALLRVKGDDARVEGVVRLTTSEGFSGYLTKRLAALRERYPGLVIEIVATNRPLDLSRREADLALRMTPATQAELVTRQVGESGWSLYAAEGYLARRGQPASVDDLTGHDAIAFDESLARTPGAQWLGDGKGARVVLRANTLLSAINAATGGFGLVVLPCVLADVEPTLRRTSSRPVAMCTVYLVVHQDLVRVARVRVVMDFVIDLLTTDAKALRGD